MRTPLTLAAAVILGPAAHAAETFTPGEPVRGTFDDYAFEFLDYNCIDCHDDATKKGGLSLEGLGPVDETNAALWKSVWAQVTLGEMPPKKKDQPEIVDRLRFSEWIVGEMRSTMKDKGGFHADRDPNKGNFVDHNLLFGELPEGIRLVPTSSPARIWRVTPQEHITRLNELINTEPDFDPKKPGLRTRGDAVPTNHGGELKLYFGTDRIIKWQGGTVAYATAVKSIPAVLSSGRGHGFENYADVHSVNSSEATQILSMAEDILRYMAYGPLSIAKPEQITDDPGSYKMEGDIRGLPSAIVYNTKVVRPMTPVHDLMKAPDVDEALLRASVEYLFEALTFRPPTTTETGDYMQIVKDSVGKVGKEDGVFMGLSAIFLHRDALFRPELVEGGKPDAHGRVMMQDWELGLAVNHALSYIRPDEELRKAITDGRMRTRDDVRREITRMLEDESIRKPRVLQFFRDYFEYDLGGYICKDEKAQASTGAPNGNGHYRAMFDATASTDRLIELILADDRDVLKQLLTTQQVVATPTDKTYFGKLRNKDEIADARKAQTKAAEENVRHTGDRVAMLEDRVAAIEKRIKADPKDRELRKDLAKQKKELAAAKRNFDAAKKAKGRGGNPAVARAELKGPDIHARVSRRSFGTGSMKPERTLATAPPGERLGILTHPSWLVSQSDAMDNHAIHRGKWIRERLLGGGIPDVPITVDAQLPDEPNTTLRERMRVTREEYCWTCHKKMDPLGLPFEMYNHAGLLRSMELNKPVDTTGEIIDSGDPALDGPVTDALDMIRKLSESERVEQVFVRHAFRFWMGRNETLNDGPVLQAAHKAYRDSGGSMNALITSLVTSDAFLYRRKEE
ncbi:hypothetical protein HAHE_17250 [Haloferula helveola]|uniref:Planctomycete cytochrome C n=1 Tax=Haloferula helveola TaxID=490095 RepID=A0ABM7RET1_9BACT|nr:hypothetical protein HAHE_17250 [Haloferula helveola]